MDWFRLLSIFSFVFILIASIQFFQLRNQFKKLKIGDTLSNKLADRITKKIKVVITFLGIGSILAVIAILIGH